MPTQVLVNQGTVVVFGGSGLSPADSGTDLSGGSGVTTGADITLTSLADGAGRQSLKYDLGADRAPEYAVLAAIETAGTPDATGRVDVYWAPSPVSTQGNANIAGNSGADAAAPDGALGSITLAEFSVQCQRIGSLRTHDGVSVNVGYVGVLRPATRYGQLVLVNETGNALAADAVEHHVALVPIIDEIQN